MSRQVAFVRHGETEWNAKALLQGQIDIPLSETGRRQAEALAPVIQALQPKQAFTSDLGRARQTAAALGLPVAQPSAAWREADLGAWAGCAKADLRREDAVAYQAWRDGRYDPPGAEPWQAFKGRIGAALAQLPPGDGTIVVVTHSGVIRAVCALLIGLHPDRIIPVDPGSLTLFDLTGPARLKAFNVVGHGWSADPPD